MVIKFYAKHDKAWDLKNEFHFPKDLVASCDALVSDFNNDHLNDFTYISDIAARGANEIRRLFIYDGVKDQLVVMKNSDKYPNIAYNKKLNCIDAFLVYGGCSTIFLKIEADSLREFASVELFNGLTVTTYNKHGKASIILQDTSNKESDIRYTNYSPLEE